MIDFKFWALKLRTLRLKVFKFCILIPHIPLMAWTIKAASELRPKSRVIITFWSEAQYLTASKCTVLRPTHFHTSPLSHFSTDKKHYCPNESLLGCRYTSKSTIFKFQDQISKISWSFERIYSSWHSLLAHHTNHFNLRLINFVVRNPPCFPVYSTTILFHHRHPFWGQLRNLHSLIKAHHCVEDCNQTVQILGHYSWFPTFLERLKHRMTEN